MPLFEGSVAVAFALAVISHASVIAALGAEHDMTDGDVLKGAIILVCEVCMKSMGLKRGSEGSHSRYRKGK